MAKVIHMTTFIRPGGGPPGYLYNLKKGLETCDNSSIIVYSPIESELRVGSLNPSLIRKFGYWLPKHISKFAHKALFPSFIFWILFFFYEKIVWNLSLKKNYWDQINTDDCVVCHNAKLGAQALGGLGKKFSQLWIMPHGPVTYSDEVTESFTEKFGESFLTKFVSARLNTMELETFNAVSGLILPTKESCASYFTDFPLLRSKFENITFRYVLTGAPQLHSFRERHDIRSDLGIDNKAIVISYFGRFHLHKGFDFFLKVAEKLTEKDQKYLFLCAGTGDLEKYIDNSKVKNLGWRKDMADLLKASDMILVPNKHSYFDLIILEALSMGKVVLTSDVGGNQYFKEKKMGVVLYKLGNVEECLSKIAQSTEELQDLSKHAKASYETYFSIPVFTRNHVALAKSLLKNQ